jgi:hypothetical protein
MVSRKQRERKVQGVLLSPKISAAQLQRPNFCLSLGFTSQLFHHQKGDHAFNTLALRDIYSTSHRKLEAFQLRLETKHECWLFSTLFQYHDAIR